MDDRRPDVAAIRFALLRRLAPGMRHRLMGQLQALQFSAELAGRLLEGDDKRPKLETSVRQLAPQTQAAVAAAATLIEWLRDDERATTNLEDSLPQYLRVAGDDWNLRGIEGTVDVRTDGAHVAKTALRELAVTSLLALTDAQPGALDVRVAAERAGDEIVVRMSATAGNRTSPLPELARASRIGCSEVNALAAAHGIACACARDEVTLRLPVVSSS
jgi:hypothetical protein